VAGVAVSRVICEYLVDLAQATRSHRDVTLGLSPRGVLIWQRVAQARAHLQGRDFVTPDDVQNVALPVLEVRLAGEFDSAPAVIKQIVESVDVPVLNGAKANGRTAK
jgi:MoxR-like ATPase